MQSNFSNSDNLESIESILSQAKELLKEAVSLSLKEINNTPSSEKKIFNLWKKYGKILYNFFIIETEKTGNMNIGKKVIKSVMFRKF